jgi:hypothetical protein
MRYQRLLLGCIITGLLLSLMVYSFQEYGQNDPQIKKYNQIFGSPEQFDNTTLSFSAEVLSVDSTNRTITALIRAGAYTFPPVEIIGVSDVSMLQKGDEIDVIGVFHDTNQVTITEMWVHHSWELTMLYLRSLLALPFVFYLFFRTWRWDAADWRFVRRKNDV